MVVVAIHSPKKGRWEVQIVYEEKILACMWSLSRGKARQIHDLKAQALHVIAERMQEGELQGVRRVVFQIQVVQPQSRRKKA
jgi:hypothetical protein